LFVDKILSIVLVFHWCSWASQYNSLCIFCKLQHIHLPSPSCQGPFSCSVCQLLFSSGSGHACWAAPSAVYLSFWRGLFEGLTCSLGICSAAHCIVLPSILDLAADMYYHSSSGRI